MSQETRTTIAGPAGDLEIAVGHPDSGGPRGVALICHPHPLYGGTMDNKVAYTLARAAELAGLASVRFNFRGVGRSAGEHDGGPGELADALAAAQHATSQYSDLPILIAGFSFGGWIALHAAAQLQPVQLVTIAPAMGYGSIGPLPAPACPWLYVHGTADDVVTPDENRPILAKLSAQPDAIWMDDVGHFFHGHLTSLRGHVVDAVTRRWDALNG